MDFFSAQRNDTIMVDTPIRLRLSPEENESSMKKIGKEIKAEGSIKDKAQWLTINNNSVLHVLTTNEMTDEKLKSKETSVV